MPVKYPINLRIPHRTTYFCFVSRCQLAHIKEVTIFCLLSVILQQLRFFCYAHISMVATIVLLTDRGNSLIKILLNQVTDMGTLKTGFFAHFLQSVSRRTQCKNS